MTASGDNESRAAAVHDQLRSAILRGDLDDVGPLSQVQLAERFGVSRTPLREAVRMLQREGLVHGAHNRQIRVAPISVDDLCELYAIRILVEPLALRLSLKRFTREDFATMRGLLRTLESSLGDDAADQYDAADRELHRQFHKYARARVSRTIDELWDHAHRYRFAYLSVVEPRAWKLAPFEHHLIVDACETGDEGSASAFLGIHLARTALTLTAQLAPTYDPEAVREALSLVAPSHVDSYVEVLSVESLERVARLKTAAARP